MTHDDMALVHSFYLAELGSDERKEGKKARKMCSRNLEESRDYIIAFVRLHSFLFEYRWGVR